MLRLDDIEREFGKKVAKIIDGLTKISGVFDTNSSLQAENFRKMLLTLADDVRVILDKTGRPPAQHAHDGVYAAR